MNRLTQVTDPANGISHYGYDGLDQLTGVSDPRSLNTSYTTDALGNVSQVLSPDTGATNYTYDPAGNLKTQQDAKGQTTQYQYDALNRLTLITRADSSTVALTYDTGTNGIGHLSGIVDPSGFTNWSYDSHGRVTQKAQNVGGSALTTQYVYDSAGQLLSAALPSGKVIGYSWANGQISALTLNGDPLVSGIVYAPFGGPQGWVYANGETVVRSYDQDGRIASHALGAVSYDNASRITGISQSNLSVLNGTKAYDYDMLNRLTSFNDGTSSISYSYDANGNRSSQVTGGGAAGGSTPPPSNPITPISTFTYDAAGRLSVANGATYQYNGLGQRVRKGAESTTLFAYDEAGQISGEYDNGGTLIEETVRLGNMPVAVLKTDGTYYVHADHLNTPRQIDNSDGHAVWAWDTFTFGGTLPSEDPLNTGTAFTYNLRHPGQYFDSETGLFQNGFRDYSPFTGRFAESDPIGLRGGSWSTYAYAQGSPLNYADPFGLSALGDAGAILGGWVGAIAGTVGGEAIDPLGGGIPGEILGNRLGSASGRAVGEWANSLLNSEIPDEDDYDDEWDEWYDESSQSCKRKGFGDGGNKGNNQAQNKSFDAATQGLTDIEKGRVHKLISGKNYDYQEIKRIANTVKNGGY